MRWPSGVKCLACESTKLSRITRTVDETKTRKEKKPNKRTRLYACLECGKRFTPTVGIIYHKSHLPLPTWFMAIAIVMDAKKGMSALQLQEHLGIGSYIARGTWSTGFARLSCIQRSTSQMEYKDLTAEVPA